MRTLFSLVVASLLIGGHDAVRTAAAASGAKPAWCAPETEALPGSVCHVDFNAPGRRTLVVFLHGLVPRSSDWQWMQQRAILREARLFHFAAIMPQAPPVGPGGAGGYAWPGATAAQPGEQALIDGWLAAQHLLEARAGKPFDEVFVVGFSSGAYFATSLAVRDRLPADGYVVLAGGSPAEPAAEIARRVPIFIGVSSKDRASAPAARALGQTLAARAWPHRMDEQPIGHMVYDVHVAHALTYLRGLVDRQHAR